MEKELAIYYSTRKAIHTTIHDPNWLNHPNITTLQNHNSMPIPPTDLTLKQECIKTLSDIGKTAKINA
jgi:hypothetical protein